MKVNAKIVNKNLIEGSELKRIDILMEVGKAICKIRTEDCCFGSGFLIKLYKGENPFYCLITNEHVLKHVLEKGKNEIEVCYDNQNKRLKIKLDGSDKRFIRDYNYMNIDLIIIEILSQDLVEMKDEYFFKEDNSFFLSPNVDYNDEGGYEKYIKENIYILQYPEGQSLSMSEGEIESIENYYFTHKSSTKCGSSGSPIFLKNSPLVLGVHQAGCGERNLGFFLGPVIESLKRNFKVGKKSFGEDTYEGEFNNDKREGYGKYTYKNRNYYIGEWSNDKKNGKGVLYNEEDCILYRGNYKDDMREKSEFPHEHPLNYKEVLNEDCTLCSQNISEKDGYKCEECSIVLCSICAAKVLYEKKNKSIHAHDLALEYRENWKCNGCGKMKMKCKKASKTSFHCKLCDFDACEKCYIKD